MIAFIAFAVGASLPEYDSSNYALDFGVDTAKELGQIFIV